MHARQPVPAALRRLSDLQDGVVTHEQVIGHGLSREVAARLVRSGSWQRLGRGLYLTHPLAPSWDALAWGGVLLGGPRARLGPEASAYRHGLRPDPPAPLGILVPADNPIESRGPWRFQRERRGARPGRSVGSPPRLNVEDTVLDLANVAQAGEVVGVVSTAVQRRLTTPDRLRRNLGLRSRHTYRQLLLDLLSDVDQGAETPLEIRYLRDVERPHGLPRGHRQTSGTGLRYVRDVRYDGFDLLVELDGRDGHEGIGRFRDMNRDNVHALHEELTLRFGWFDVTARACTMAFQVYVVLSRRGYDRPFRRCQRCRRVPELELLGA